MVFMGLIRRTATNPPLPSTPPPRSQAPAPANLRSRAPEIIELIWRICLRRKSHDLLKSFNRVIKTGKGRSICSKSIIPWSKVEDPNNQIKMPQMAAKVMVAPRGSPIGNRLLICLSRWELLEIWVGRWGSRWPKRRKVKNPTKSAGL